MSEISEAICRQEALRIRAVGDESRRETGTAFRLDEAQVAERVDDPLPAARLELVVRQLTQCVPISFNRGRFISEVRGGPERL